MSVRLRGNNTLATGNSGIVWDTVAAGKSFTVQTNSVSRLVVNDTTATFSGYIDSDRLVEGYVLVNTSTYPVSYAITSATPKNIRAWGTTAGFTATLPLATTTTVGSSWTIHNTSTVQIGVFTNSAGVHTAIESNYSATFVLIDTGTDAVASWKIVCEGVPTNVTAGTVLMSNGTGAMPTYQQVYPTMSTGTWTPSLRFICRSNTDLDTNTFYDQRGQYSRIKVSSTGYLNHYSFWIRVNVYTYQTFVDPEADINIPVVRGFPSTSQTAYGTMSVVSYSYAFASYTTELLTSGSSFDSLNPHFTGQATHSPYTITADGTSLYCRGGYTFATTTKDIWSGSITFYTA